MIHYISCLPVCGTTPLISVNISPGSNEYFSRTHSELGRCFRPPCESGKMCEATDKRALLLSGKGDFGIGGRLLDSPHSAHTLVALIDCGA